MSVTSVNVHTSPPQVSTPATGRPWLPVLLSGLLLAVVRALTLPRSLWEYDEHLFASAIRRFEPLIHHPHPPGYPLLVGLGKALDLVFHDPFRSLVALSLVSSLVGFPALYAALRRLLGREDAGAAHTALFAALLFHLSPAMLVQSTLALSDPPAVMFLSLALLGAARVLDDAGDPSRGATASALLLGLASSAAVGCRPQLAIAVLPMLAVVAWEDRRRRITLLTWASFAALAVAWLVPLIVKTGGWSSFLQYQLSQIASVAANDAGASRAHRGALSIVAHFVANPWGPRALALPLLILAAYGIVLLVRSRRRAVLPLLVFSALYVLTCIAGMDPADGTRYALPALPALALGMVIGLRALAERVGKPALYWIAVVAVIAFSAVYAWPVLAPRAQGPSPPAQAEAWLVAHVPPQTMVMVSPELRAHADYALARFDHALVGDDERCRERQPGAPVYLFVEGASGDPRAIVFGWPPSDAYRRLTRNHYRVVSLVPQGPGPCGGERHHRRRRGPSG